MWLEEQLVLKRLPWRNKPVRVWWKKINQAQELAKQLAFKAMQDNQDACTSFTQRKQKIDEKYREEKNRGITNTIQPWEHAFYIWPNWQEIKVKKTSNHDFEKEFQSILSQIPLILWKDEFYFSNYFPKINPSDNSETIPKKATKTYVQKIFQLLFFKMYSAGIKPNNNTSEETKRKRDAWVFLKEKFWLGSFPTSFPTDIKEKEEHFQKQAKDKR